MPIQLLFPPPPHPHTPSRPPPRWAAETQPLGQQSLQLDHDLVIRSSLEADGAFKCSLADGDLNDGAPLGHHIELDAHGWEGCEDVAEHDDAVWVEGMPGL